MSHFKAKCTKFYSRRLSVRQFVRPFVFDTVDESQRRRHGVTAAIVVDVVGALKPCVSLPVCSFVRSSRTPSKIQTDGQTDKEIRLFVHPSLRWSLTLMDGGYSVARLWPM